MRIVTRIVICIGAAEALIWLSGTFFAIFFMHFPPNACQRPFQVWALVWPVFPLLPDGSQDAIVRWSFTLCPGAHP